jgi:hypothetical protein
MNRANLVTTLSASLAAQLAEDLVAEFLLIRQDVLTGTLGRASLGKFVETVVQCLQYLATGTYDAKPSVDDFLNNAEKRAAALPDDLKICAARVARATYTLRNKRNIAHKGAVDTNTYDLRFAHAAAQWIMAEMLRQVTGDSMEKAGALIDQVMAPIGGLVEDLGGRKVVLADVSAREEMLVLLHHAYPDGVSRKSLVADMRRRDESTVRKSLRELWSEKHVEELEDGSFKLTRQGFDAALRTVRDALT